MECNKDEAVRAKSIAESKLEKRDFDGAKKFALKAHTLFPGLDGTLQLLKTVDVYVSAENKISGEVDWYGVLGVNPSADDEAIRRQYRKLALVLHPDKNKAVGADGAFRLITEAWNLLSDKARRLAYNQRIGYKGFQEKAQMHTGGPSATARANGTTFNFASRTASIPKPQTNSPKVPANPIPKPSQQRTDTFWTTCHACKMYYEYLQIYLNQTLLCPNCHGPFTASQTAPPQNFSKSTNQIPRPRHHIPTDNVPNQNAFVPGKKATASRSSVPGQAGSHSFRFPSHRQDPLPGAVSAGGDPFIAAKAANVVQQAQDKLRRAHTESHSSVAWESCFKKQKIDGESSRYGMNYHMPQGNGVFGTSSGSASGSRIYGFSGSYRQPNSTCDLTASEIRYMLKVKTQNNILNKLKTWKSEAMDKVAVKEKQMTKQSKKQNLGSMDSAEGLNRNGNSDSSAMKVADQPGRVQISESADSESKESKEDPSATAMSVPDPDFHDFDLDRAESSFGDNEVWAAYDDDDGMPRFYAMVNKVISMKPFKLRISWLNSKSNSEFSTVDWVGSGFYKTCGEFRVGKYETCKSINAFSQKVHWFRSPRGSILIFPRKGDAWALYKNWSSEWNEHTPDEIIHNYEMATVLEDYNEEHGVSVAPLLKVVGFRTVFRPNLAPQFVRRIRREEMFRFSHRVPHHLLTGLEGRNAPQGCLELDPAATPLELIQVISEGNEVPAVSGNATACQEVSKGLNEIADRANSVQAVNTVSSQ